MWSVLILSVIVFCLTLIPAILFTVAFTRYQSTRQVTPPVDGVEKSVMDQSNDFYDMTLNLLLGALNVAWAVVFFDIILIVLSVTLWKNDVITCAFYMLGLFVLELAVLALSVGSLVEAQNCNSIFNNITSPIPIPPIFADDFRGLLISGIVFAAVGGLLLGISYVGLYHNHHKKAPIAHILGNTFNESVEIDFTEA